MHYCITSIIQVKKLADETLQCANRESENSETLYYVRRTYFFGHKEKDGNGKWIY